MRSRRTPYVVCFSLVFPLVILWSLATPVMAVVDDPAHIAAAAGAVRGEFHQPTIDTYLGRQQAVEVPGRLAALGHVADCLAMSSDNLPTQCAKPTPGTDKSVVVATTAIRYPPLFYWAVGWPTLILSGASAYWGVTVMAAIIDSTLLSLGLWAIINFGRRAAILAWLVCLTPEVLYLAGSANDSGYEIAAAIAAWSCLSALVTYERPPPRLVIMSTVATVSFVLARPASPAWVLVMLLSFAVVAGHTRLRHYLPQRTLQLGAGVVAASVLVSGAWRLYVGAPNLLHVTPPHHTSLKEAVRVSLSNVLSVRGTLLSQVGTWLATPLPLGILLLWIVAFSVLLVGGIGLAPRRWLVTVGALTVCVVAIPVIANVIEFNKAGLWWQGRDGIPFGVGIPILLALAVHDRMLRSSASRRLVTCGIASVGLLHVAAFIWLLHRYAIGVNGSWRPSKFVWQPPGGIYLIASLFLVFAMTLCYIAWRWMTLRSSRRPVGRPLAETDERKDDHLERLPGRVIARP